MDVAFTSYPSQTSKVSSFFIHKPPTTVHNPASFIFNRKWIDMKLFAIRDTSSNKLVAGEDFKGKPEAKRRRDELNKEANSANRYVVTYGKEHRKFKG